MTTPHWKDKVFEDWWPLGQSMILVRAPFRRAATALQNQAYEWQQRVGAIHRFDWLRVSCIDELFRSVETFTTGPLTYYSLPTKGDWTVIWCNSSACTGHESLAHCLTGFQKLETIHFYCTDRNSTQLAGTHFTYRKPTATEAIIQRDVYCCNQGSRWSFRQDGEPLPEEDLERYAAKRKRDRLNEEGFMALLGRLGVQPWLENTYDFGHKLLSMADTRKFPATQHFTFQQVRGRAGAPPPEPEDKELVGLPDYLRGNCRKPNEAGPARLLADGKWCGHGEPTFWIFDIATDAEDRFEVRLPQAEGPAVVEAVPIGGKNPFLIYDSRRHPASVFLNSEKEALFLPPERCPKCDSTVFRIAVGFEVPTDAQSPNDTSWFVLAMECCQCRLKRIAYDDETA